MLVVADTSPINYLVLLEHTAILPALYTRVFLPPAVVTELQDLEAPEEVRAWVANLPATRVRAEWLPVLPPQGELMSPFL